jgi:hypothetical protein
MPISVIILVYSLLLPAEFEFINPLKPNGKNISHLL